MDYNGHDMRSAIFIYTRNVYVTDVARFKESVRVGEYLFYDETADGIRLDCKVLRKFPHFAITDCGSFEWNWLCVKNKERIPLK